jgi:hypothetical protein
MDISSLQEIQHNDLVRKRLAKRIVRDCFRDGEFENFHADLAELDDDAVEAIMKDAVKRLAKKIVRGCFRGRKFENLHAGVIFQQFGLLSPRGQI